ncbi:MAG: galactose oxidase early set domain-containing protein [Geminicoccaceae bacterium]
MRVSSSHLGMACKAGYLQHGISLSRRARLWLAVLLAGAALAGPSPATADNGIGGWSSTLAKWPLIPIHAVLLPDGRVLTYGSNGDGAQTGQFIYDIWSPTRGFGANAHWTLPNVTSTDLFCSAQIVLPRSGNVALLGGDKWNGSRTTNVGNNKSNVFSPATDALTPGAPMRAARWYATATTLPNGETFIQGGKSGGEGRPEIRDVAGNFRELSGIDTSTLYWWYPRNWVAPDGRIFGFSDRTMYYINPKGKGTIQILGDMAKNGPSGITSTEVMFAPGRILRVGGGAIRTSQDKPGRKAAVVIDINGGTPKVTAVAPMPVGLHWATATVAADGRVVVTGGGPSNNQLAGANYNALIWNPSTNTWTVGAKTQPTAKRARLYHSIGLLLPDATILVGGGGASGTTVKGPAINTNAEIYYPPYLYTAAGQLAPRPQIKQAPAVVTVGTRFAVTVDNPLAIARVTLVKTGSVTHSFNMDQGFMGLSFTRSGNQLLINAPANLNLATPGRYLLFVLNAQGVPSVARIVAVADAASPPQVAAFDGLEYIASYPDLIQTLGANAAAGTQHYQLYGQAEGRVPDSFNAAQYLTNYADLRAAFGTNLDAAAAHYITSGYREGRTDKAPPTGY